jgi:dienelactone hydrolase
MADTPSVFDAFIRARGQALRATDAPPASRRAWEDRRATLRASLLSAIGPFPEKPCPLEPKVLGTLSRSGCRIEKLVFQSRPDVWVTANLYVPEPTSGKRPAVLAVHGHWPWARIDPTVQARCLGLVKLGFVVLAVDAFGSGERYTHPAQGTYHGALYGATLWPIGQTLLGMQVYDNRRAVDYLLTRPEVDGTRLGVTGASGGGNQSMYAGALDERLQAAVPVCSVGNYQAYLRAACCVCEVVPGALRFTEEGDVLGLVAPRALLVINASQDANQFSPGEVAVSIDRAKRVYALLNEPEKLKHVVFESKHDYSRPMREAMYGWMTRWLKGEGQGEPIPEPPFDVEDPEALRCYPDAAKRPASWLTPPTFADREGRALLAKSFPAPPDHAEEWDSTAVHLRGALRKVLGDFPPLPRPVAKLGATQTVGDVATTPLTLPSEPGLTLEALLRSKVGPGPRQPACILLHPDGAADAVAHPFAAALAKKGWLVVAPTLRATGPQKPPNDGVRTATDHNSAEHAVWLGRPLLGQWVTDVLSVLDWLALQAALDRRRLMVAGIGQAGLVALAAGALFDDRLSGVVLLSSPVTYLTDAAYGASTRMGTLAPGIVSKVGDVPQLAAMAAPRRLAVIEGVTPQGTKLTEGRLRDAYAFTAAVYKAHAAADKFTAATEVRWDEVAGNL